jgi:hypothetical protein
MTMTMLFVERFLSRSLPPKANMYAILLITSLADTFCHRILIGNRGKRRRGVLRSDGSSEVYHYVRKKSVFLLLPLCIHPLSKRLTFPFFPFFSGNFDCLDDELDSAPVNVVLRTADGGKQHLLWKSTPAVSEEVFQVPVSEKIKATRYELCFRNIKSSDAMDRLIGFNVRVESAPRSLEEQEPGPDEERALNLISTAASMREGWDTLMDHYVYLQTREEQHKQLMDSIYSRVMQVCLSNEIQLE